MTVYGFHASHEQMHPGDLLQAAIRAEQAGFAAGMCSDHLVPWSERQGHSGFAWSWLGAALQATRLPFGVVTAPGQRYHPAVLAQAIGTLAAMYPGRFWAAVGTGEACNEHVTGQRWPRKELRNARLRECVDVMRALLAGEEVSHDGLVTVDRARLWTRPERVPDLVCPALTERTAAWGAGWADGLITINAPVTQLRRMIDAYRDRGGRGRLYLQVHLSWAPDERTALAVAHDQWRNQVFSSPLLADVEMPAQFDAMGAQVRAEDVAETVLVSADPDRHAAWLREYADLGFDEIYLHHVGQKQEEFIDVFGERVLPQLTGAG